MSWSLFLTSLSLLSLSCFWCRFSVRHMGHKAGFHLCLEGSTRGAKRKVAEIFRTWKSFVCLRDADKCPPRITRDPCTDSSSLKGFSRHLRGCLFVCLFSFYLLLMEYDSVYAESESESRSVLSPCNLAILQARTLEWAALSLLHGIFPTQGSNSGLLHCRWILYRLSLKGSPSICRDLSKQDDCSAFVKGYLRKIKPIRFVFLFNIFNVCYMMVITSELPYH